MLNSRTRLIFVLCIIFFSTASLMHFLRKGLTTYLWCLIFGGRVLRRYEVCLNTNTMNTDTKYSSKQDVFWMTRLWRYLKGYSHLFDDPEVNRRLLVCLFALLASILCLVSAILKSRHR